MKNHTIQYRPDIDGLRAIAILSVIIFHFFDNFLPSGYVGVDIFFVISGFLITKIILQEHQAKSFSFSNFYLRRIRRILPALLTMLFVSFIIGFLTLTSGNMIWFSKGLYYSSLQISNFFFQRTVDYFNEGRSFEPLLHTWSLGVEEQFYILMPFIIYCFARFQLTKKQSLYIIIGLLLTSLCTSQYLVLANQKIAFYSLLSRFWELCTGCLLAFVEVNFSKINISRRTDNILSALGVIFLLASVFLIKYAVFPGFSALLPCLAATLIIFSGRSQTSLLSKFLSNRFLVFIGKISYSLYLWHLPIFVFYKEYMGEKSLEVSTSIVLLCLIFTISYLSWRFVETPFRKTYKFDQEKSWHWNIAKHPFFVTILCLLFFSVLSKICQNTHGMDFRLGKSPLLTEKDLDQYGSFTYGKKCGLFKKKTEFPRIEDCTVRNGVSPKVAIFGDSHAGHYSTSVMNWAEKRNLSFASFYYFSCPPFLTSDHQINNNPRCLDYRQEVLKIIKERNDLEYVFLGSSWFEHNITDAQYPTTFREDFEQTVAEISKTGKKLVVLGRVPDFNVEANIFSPIECIEKSLTPLQKVFPTAPLNCTEISITSMKNQIKFNEMMRNVTLKYKNVWFFDPFPYFCNEKNCSVVQDGKLMYADKGHLNKNGSTYIGSKDMSPLNVDY